MTKPRRLKGHKAAVTCCVASRSRPGTIVSCGEDGCICWFDLRCKDAAFMIEVGEAPASSLCFKAGNEDVIYVSIGTEIKGFDVQMGSSGKPLESYSYSKEEINQIAFSSKSSFLAAADDSGDVKIIDTHQQQLYKTLRVGHTNICSSVQFLPWKPWEVITGGLDSRLVMWDFSRGRPYNTVDFGKPRIGSFESSSSTTQCCNPAFAHAIAVPEMDMLEGPSKICAVARGDGMVTVIDIESEMAVAKSKSFSKLKKGSNSRTRDGAVQGGNTPGLDPDGKRWLHLDYGVGGHNAAVSCVAFSLFGEKGKFIVSGGNDALVKVWDWSKYYDVGGDSSVSDLHPLNIDVRKKVNWLCTTAADSENLVVCDTSKMVKVYSVS